MNESAERDYEWFEALQSLEKERQRKMGIEWGPADNHWRYDYRPPTTVEDRVDWGLLDEFLVYVGQDGLWLQHARCKRPDAPARWRQSVADLVLAVEEHMKECGK